MSTTQVFKNPRAKHGFQGRTCSIISVGSYVPERILTNAELEKKAAKAKLKAVRARA